MLKNLFLSAVAVASLGFSQVQAVKPGEVESSDYSQPVRKPYLERQAQVIKLSTQLTKWTKILEGAQASNGARRHKSKTVDYAQTRVQALEADLRKLQKSMIRTTAVMEDNKQRTISLNSPNLNNSINDDGTPDHDNNRLKDVFVQPLMDTLLQLAAFGTKYSPWDHIAHENVYISHQDVLNLMEALFPLKSRFVRTMDWRRDVFYKPDVTDALLTKEGLTREDYDHFWTETQARFDAEVHKTAASMFNTFSWDNIEIAASGVKLTQLGTHWLLKRGTYQKNLDNEYRTYVRLVSRIKAEDSSSTSFFFRHGDLSILPPSSLWSRLTALQMLNLGCNQITDVGPLQQMTGLRSLLLDYNQITDVDPLQQMTRLQKLCLDHNQITDVGPLRRMTGLQQLDLDHNQITDVRPLRGMTVLMALYLDYNQITDVRPLRAMTVLQKLTLSQNPNLWAPLPDESPEVSQARIASNHELESIFSTTGIFDAWRRN